MKFMNLKPRHILLKKKWLDHHLEFSKLISKYNPKAVLEYGGANGFLGSLCLKNGYLDKWENS